MTIAELIEMLSKLDQDRQVVFVNVYDDGANESDKPAICLEKDGKYYFYAS